MKLFLQPLGGWRNGSAPKAPIGYKLLTEPSGLAYRLRPRENACMDIPLPPSPFGSSRSALDLGPFRFGAFVRSHDLYLGFFIDEQDLAPRLQTYARAVLGCSLAEAFLAVALPPPIRDLIVNFHPEWRERAKDSRPTGSNQNFSDIAKTSPWSTELYDHHEIVAESFAWIGTSSPRGFCSDDSNVCSTVLEAWRAELASQGVGSTPWTGLSLRFIHNGHVGEDSRALARQECVAALEAFRLGRELPAPAPSPPGARPRI